MFLPKVIAVLLLVKASNTLYGDGAYRVPEPLVEVLQPQGFRISIEDSPGISHVSFQINVNEYSHRRNGGRLAENVLQAVNGRWSFDERNARLKLGDKIYYEIYVVNNKLRYGTNGQKYFQVEELPRKNPLEASFPQSLQSVQPIPCKVCTNNNKFQTHPTTPSPETTTSYTPIIQDLILNCSQSLATLLSELETVRKVNQQLTALIEKDPDAKKLILSGRIPPDDDPVFTAAFIIHEKLELNPNIIFAIRKSDRNIVFEVATLSEKLEILEAAKEKLQNSRILIS